MRRPTRAAIEWAAQQIKERNTIDLNKPTPKELEVSDPYTLWLDRPTFFPPASRARATYGPMRITPDMKRELRRYREAAGLSAAKLSRKVGVAQDHVGQIEVGNITRTTAETWNELMSVCRTEIAARAVELDRIQQEWEAA